MKYRIVQKKGLVKGGERKPMQVASQVNHGRITTRSIAEEVAQITSLGRGDVYNVLSTLSDVAMRYVSMGYSVELGEMGTFTPRLSAKAVPANEVYGREHIRGVMARFTPSVELKAALKAVTFELEETEEEKQKRKASKAGGTCPTPSPGHEEGPSKPKQEGGNL